MKIITIASCVGDCPHISVVSKNGKVFCEWCHPKRELEFLDKIPEWCPLEDKGGCGGVVLDPKDCLKGYGEGPRSGGLR